jgi:AraC-like DNA-binding protein
VQGVPESFDCPKDQAQFKHVPELAGVELYHAYISRYVFEPHTHEAFGIGRVEFGAERFSYGGTQHIAGTDAIVLMNPDELHTGQAMTEAGWRYRMIYLTPDFLEALSGEKNWRFANVVQHDAVRAQQVSRVLTGLWDAPDQLAAEGLLLSLLELFRPYAEIGVQAKTESLHRFTSVNDYLHAYYDQPVTLSDLAAVAGLSPYHFQRQFKAHYHVTPHQMLMAVRLFAAKQMLGRGMAAAEVAAAAGLSDQAHLTRAFAARYGVTPIRYQKQVRPD